MLPDVVTHLGSANFGRALADWLAPGLSFDYCTAFCFEATSGVPSCLVAEEAGRGSPEIVRRLADEYVEGAFLACLQHERLLAGRWQPGIEEFDPNGVSAHFRHRFYTEPGIAHELVLRSQGPVGALYLALNRCATSRGFDGVDRSLLASRAPLIEALLGRHATLRTAQASRVLPSPEAVVSLLRAALMRSSVGLTPRERQVAERLVLGDLPGEIAVRLGISAQTVASHRKSVYAKLGVRRQEALLRRVLHLAAVAE